MGDLLSLILILSSSDSDEEDEELEEDEPADPPRFFLLRAFLPEELSLEELLVLLDEDEL